MVDAVVNGWRYGVTRCSAASLGGLAARSQLWCAAYLPMGLPDNVWPRAPFAAAALVGSRVPPADRYADAGGRMSTRGAYAVDAAAASVHLKSRSRQVAQPNCSIQLYIAEHMRPPEETRRTGNDLTDTETMEGSTLCREVRGAALEQLALPRAEVLLGPAPSVLNNVLLVLDADCVGHGR